MVWRHEVWELLQGHSYQVEVEHREVSGHQVAHSCQVEVEHLEVWGQTRAWELSCLQQVVWHHEVWELLQGHCCQVEVEHLEVWRHQVVHSCQVEV